MATTPPRERMTLERFLELPEEKPALEFEPDGTVTQKMSPTVKHILIQKGARRIDRSVSKRQCRSGFA